MSDISSPSKVFETGEEDVVVRDNSKLLQNCFLESKKSLTGFQYKPETLFKASPHRIVSIFSVKVSDVQRENAVVSRNRFVTVSELGTVALWDYEKHAAEWTMSLNIPETVYGNIVPGKENNEPPFLFIQSRICGIRLYRFEGSVLDKPSWKSLNEQHFQEMPVSTHIGFCKMVYHESPTVGPLLLFPDQQESIWILNKRHIGNISKQPVPQIEAKSTVMFMMVCNSQCPEEGTFVLYGLEDGTLKASSISAKHGGEKEEADMEAKAWDDEMVLNQCGNSSSDRNIVGEVEDDLVTPLCGVFEKEKNLIVIGTNTKMLYILKSGHRQLKFEGKKRLINTGINCMELHSSAKLMVTGGWDGVIRLFGLPTLNQIIAINYHKTAITSLYFLDKVDKNFPSFKKGKDDYEEPPEKLDRKKCPLVDLNEDKPLPRPFFLLVGATNGIVSCWNLYPSVH